MGMAYIDGITIQYEDKVMAQKETLSAQRLGVKIIEPIEDPMAGMDLGLIIIIILVIIFILTVIYFVIRFLQQRKLNAEAELIRQISIEDKYLESLKSIDLSAEDRRPGIRQQGSGKPVPGQPQGSARRRPVWRPPGPLRRLHQPVVLAGLQPREL